MQPQYPQGFPPPGYLPPPPGADVEPVRPSAWWFGVAAAAGVLGIVLAIVLFVRTYSDFVDRIDGFQRITVPGDGTVELDGTGGFTIYHEYEGADFSDGGFFEPDIFDVTLTAPDGSQVVLRNYTSNVTYATGGHEGIALYSFTADEPGTYQLSAQGESSTLAVGRGIGRGLVGGIVAGIVVGFVGVVAGIVIAIVVGVRRSNERRRRRQYWPGPPGAGLPYGGYGAYPAYGAPPGWSPPSPGPPR